MTLFIVLLRFANHNNEDPGLCKISKIEGCCKYPDDGPVGCCCLNTFGGSFILPVVVIYQHCKLKSKRKPISGREKFQKTSYCMPSPDNMQNTEEC